MAKKYTKQELENMSVEQLQRIDNSLNIASPTSPTATGIKKRYQKSELICKSIEPDNSKGGLYTIRKGCTAIDEPDMDEICYCNGVCDCVGSPGGTIYTQDPHRQCNGTSCVWVDGPGVNECGGTGANSSSGDTGWGADCDCGTTCTYKCNPNNSHHGCELGTASDPGNFCDPDDTGGMLSCWHLECNANFSCGAVEGAGPHLCTDTSDCGGGDSHYECVGSECREVGGAGADTCLNDSDCSVDAAECALEDGFILDNNGVCHSVCSADLPNARNRNRAACLDGDPDCGACCMSTYNCWFDMTGAFMGQDPPYPTAPGCMDICVQGDNKNHLGVPSDSCNYYPGPVFYDGGESCRNPDMSYYPWWDEDNCASWTGGGGTGSTCCVTGYNRNGWYVDSSLSCQYDTDNNLVYSDSIEHICEDPEQSCPNNILPNQYCGGSTGYVYTDDISVCPTNDAIGECGGTCTSDADGDGVCDDVDTCVGSWIACPTSNTPGNLCNAGGETYCSADGVNATSCSTVDAIGVCGGTCASDADGDGICDDNGGDDCFGSWTSCPTSTVPGNSCNTGGDQYCSSEGTGACPVVDALGICNGTCASDADADGICDDIDNCVGSLVQCPNSSVPFAYCNTGGDQYCTDVGQSTCPTNDAIGICNGTCTSDADADGICDDGGGDDCVGSWLACPTSNTPGTYCNSGGQTYCSGVGQTSCALVDQCGVCGGDNSSCLGCDGVPNSNAVFDNCGDCGGDNTDCCGGLGEAQNDCSAGGLCNCNCYNNYNNGVGIPGAPCGDTCELTFDDCSVCGGDSSSCTDCAGVPNGNAQIIDCPAGHASPSYSNWNEVCNAGGETYCSGDIDYIGCSRYDAIGVCGGACQSNADGDIFCDDNNGDPCNGTVYSCPTSTTPGEPCNTGGSPGDTYCSGDGVGIDACPVVDAAGVCDGTCTVNVDGDLLCDDVDDCIGAWENCPDNNVIGGYCNNGSDQYCTGDGMVNCPTVDVCGICGGPGEVTCAGESEPCGCSTIGWECSSEGCCRNWTSDFGYYENEMDCEGVCKPNGFELNVDTCGVCGGQNDTCEPEIGCFYTGISFEMPGGPCGGFVGDQIYQWEYPAGFCACCNTGGSSHTDNPDAEIYCIDLIGTAFEAIDGCCAVVGNLNDIENSVNLGFNNNGCCGGDIADAYGICGEPFETINCENCDQGALPEECGGQAFTYCQRNNTCSYNYGWKGTQTNATNLCYFWGLGDYVSHVTLPTSIDHGGWCSDTNCVAGQNGSCGTSGGTGTGWLKSVTCADGDVAFWDHWGNTSSYTWLNAGGYDNGDVQYLGCSYVCDGPWDVQYATGDFEDYGGGCMTYQEWLDSDFDLSNP